MKTILTDEQILDYLDGALGPMESAAIENLATSPENIARFQELRAIHVAMSTRGEVEAPSRNFTQKVMDGLDAYRVKRPSMRNGILLFCGMITATGIAVMLLQGGIFDNISGSIGFNAAPINNEWIKKSIHTFDYNMKPILNGLLIVVIGLSFVLLDRTILRPLFESRALRQKQKSLSA